MLGYLFTLFTTSSLEKITIHCPEFHWLLTWTFTTFLTFSFLTFLRATVKKGVTFRTATPSNSLLWDITLDMGADGAIAVVCQRKAPIPGKRQVCSYYSTCQCMLFILLLLRTLSHISRLKLLLFEWTNNTQRGIFHVLLDAGVSSC